MRSINLFLKSLASLWTVIIVLPVATEGLECARNFRTTAIDVQNGDYESLKRGYQYIVPELNFTCDGRILNWTLQANINRRGSKRKSLSLQIWRPADQSSPSGLIFVKVAEENYRVTLSGVSNTVVPLTLTPTQTLTVNSGDILGISVPEEDYLRVVATSVSEGSFQGIVYAAEQDDCQFSDDNDDDDDSYNNPTSFGLNCDRVTTSSSLSIVISPILQISMTIEVSTTTIETAATITTTTIEAAATTTTTTKEAAATITTTTIAAAATITTETTTTIEAAATITTTTTIEAAATITTTTIEAAATITTEATTTTSLLTRRSSLEERHSTSDIIILTHSTSRDIYSTGITIATDNGSKQLSDTIKLEIGWIVGIVMFIGLLLLLLLLLSVVLVKTKLQSRNQPDTSLLKEDEKVHKAGEYESEYCYFLINEDDKTQSNYEKIVGHEETLQSTPQVTSPFVNQRGTSDYSEAYEDLDEAEGELSDSLYHFVPSSQARQSRHWKSAVLKVAAIEEGTETGSSAYENAPFDPPPDRMDKLYDQLYNRRCLEIPQRALKRESVIGIGQFGEVFKATWETPVGAQEVAIKMLKVGAEEKEKVKFLQEIAIMGQFMHPHIVKLIGAVTIRDPYMIVLEFLHGGDLLTYLQDLAPNNETDCVPATLPLQCLNFCRDISNGMKYLAKKGFVHRDLAARNILLDKHMKCKIADFGLSKDLYEGVYYASTGGKIPLKWTAPEAIFYKKYSPASDVWSYGMLMFEIWSLGYKPFPNYTNEEVLEVLQMDNSYVQPPPPGCPRAIYELMVSCWHFDHHCRPDFEHIYTYLQVYDDHLLTITEEHIEEVEDKEMARKLGAPLEYAFKMYTDLQSFYQK